MPVRRLKYLEKKEGLGNPISSEICATGLSVWRSSTFMRITMARSIHYLEVMPLACLTTVPR